MLNILISGVVKKWLQALSVSSLLFIMDHLQPAINLTLHIPLSLMHFVLMCSRIRKILNSIQHRLKSIGRISWLTATVRQPRRCSVNDCGHSRISQAIFFCNMQPRFPNGPHMTKGDVFQDHLCSWLKSALLCFLCFDSAKECKILPNRRDRPIHSLHLHLTRTACLSTSSTLLWRRPSTVAWNDDALMQKADFDSADKIHFFMG